MIEDIERGETADPEGEEELHHPGGWKTYPWLDDKMFKSTIHKAIMVSRRR